MRGRAVMLAAIGFGVVGLAKLLHRAEVEGSSMIPTLLPGDRVLLRRRRAAEPLRPGTVVGFMDPRPGSEVLMIKRVAMVDGDAVTVLGDNRAASTDSSTFGTIDRRSIQWVMLRRYGRPAVAP